ncbi:MAG: glycoside hydrolase family 28 protein [Bacteroidia bacterium]
MKKILFLAIFLAYGLIWAQKPYFNVKEHGATGVKADKVTTSLQAAIDAAHAAGGGTVYFPPGDYLSGSLILKSNVTLEIEGGATLWASQDPADYPFLTTANRPCLIYADSAYNIGIRGKGRIHGQARRTYEDLKKVDRVIRGITENAEASGVEMKMYYKVDPLVRMITLENCVDVTLEDIDLIESCSWTVSFKWCERVYVRGIYLYASLEKGVNADGLDIDGCKDVTISDCVITCGDDAIVLKSTLANNKKYQNCENVTVTNCVLTSTSTGLKIGTETNGDFRHIVFTNCVIRNSNRGLSIVVRDGATVENVIFSNITIETNRKHFNWWGNGDAIYVVLIKRSAKARLGTIRNVLFENIIAHGQGTSKIEGYAPDSLHAEGRRLENIQLRNVQLFMYAEDYRDKRATHGFEAHHVDGLTVENLEINWAEDRTEPKWGSAAYFYDVNNLRLDGFRGRQGLLTGLSPVIALRNVENAMLKELEAEPGSGVLVSVKGKKTAAVILRDLDPTGQAKEAFRMAAEVDEKAVEVR